MKVNHSDIEKLLARSASKEQMESARERILNDVQSKNRVDVMDEANVGSEHSLRWRLVAIAAAVLLAALIPAMTILRRAPATFAGKDIRYNEIVRSAGGPADILVLADGSQVEMRPKSELSLERADDGVRIRLNKGSVIVNAVQQHDGHLYVQTNDVLVSVVGTVFLVNAEEEGSRVAVIEGEVRVKQGKIEKSLRPGEQVATNPSMPSAPVKEEISWSKDVVAHLALLEQSTPPAEKKAVFEAVSVRPGPPPSGGGRGSGGSPCVGRGEIDPSRFVVRNTTVYNLITWAYGKDCLAEAQVLSGGPGWIQSDRFNIEANLPAGSPSYTMEQVRSGNAPKLQEMLQSMLADRFQLVLRGERKETSVYALTAPKGTSKLRASKDDDEPSLSLTEQRNSSGGRFAQILGTKVSMARLANVLGWNPATGKFVLDRTGISGEFNIDVQFAPENQTFLDVVTRQTGVPPNYVGLPLPAAIEEQLGLKLEAIKAPVEFLVVDHIEKPSEN